METEPFLRLNEILDHMVAAIDDIDKTKEAPPPQILNSLKQECFEAKKISDRVEHENKDLKEIKIRLHWVEEKIKSFEEKK